MGEVIYSLNGKYFKDYGIYISSSDGFGELKPKKRTTYDWAERHGTAMDFNEKPKYEAREIMLDGWVKGSGWADLLAKFNGIMSEFRKAGKQRLIIEVFGNAYVYDVVCEDDISLKKTFKDGEMVGTFTLKMTEYSPIKKTFRFVGTSLNLAFTSPDWMEINIDGVVEFQKGTVSITKSLSAGKHYITVAGDIDSITNLTTNATEL